MLTHLYGKCNGADIEFTRQSNEPDGASLWTCVVPKSATGTYVLTLSAVDDAGNSGYCATVQYNAYYEAGMLKYRWEIIDISSVWNADEVASIFGIDSQPRSQ